MSSSYKLIIATRPFALSLLLFCSTPALAGFEWTPVPAEAATAPENQGVEIQKGSALPIPPPVVEEEILASPPKQQTMIAPPSMEKPIKSDQPVMKTRIIDQSKQPVKTATPKVPPQNNTAVKTISRKNIQPAPVPAVQPTNTASSVPAKTPVPAKAPQPLTQPPIAPSQTAEVQQQPAQSSVPRRKKPNMPSRQAAAQPETKINSETLAAANNKAPRITPEPINSEEQNEVAAKSTELKINPYPKKSGQVTARKKPMGDDNMDPQAAGEQALQNVYAGNKEDIQWNQNNTFSVAEGFGSDIPLALALTQIVPPNYAYSFGEGVNPGKKVSWSGGKPWNDVLAETLAPLGLSFEIKGQKLILQKSDGRQAASEPVSENNAAATLKKKLNSHQTN